MKKIMVVDDEATITTHLEKRLTMMGYDVVGKASSGEQAVELAKCLKPDLILMDIVMPGKIDGIEASKRINAEMDIPIIFLTAHAADHFLMRARNVEPYGYVLKPFQPSEIKASIEIALYKKQIEQRWRKSEKKFRSVVESAQDAIVLSDGRGKIISWNRGARKMFGYEEKEVLGQPLSILMPERYREVHQKEMERTISKGEFRYAGKTIELHGLKKDGSDLPLEISCNTWSTEDGRFYCGIIRDITERKRAQEATRASEESLYAIIQKTPGAIIIVDDSGIVQFVNPATESLFGKSAEEFVGSMFGYPVVTDDTIEMEVLLKGGKRGIVEMRSVEKTWRGKSAHFISLFDITTIKNAEETLIQLNEKLKKLNEMQTDFIAVASHELRTPLTSIKNAIDILASGKAGALNQNQERFLTMAVRNIDRLANIINDLLNLAKLEAGKAEIYLSEVDLISVIQQAIATFKTQADAKAQTLETDCPKGLPTVYADQDRVDQILYNLMSNALKFTAERGGICVSARIVDCLLPEQGVDSDLSGMNDDLKARSGFIQESLKEINHQWIEVSVTDTGVGLSPDDQKRIFDQFVQVGGSMGRTNEGTGLGLSIVKELIAAQGGKISVESQAGEGSRFFFTLPVFSRQTADSNTLETEIRQYMGSPPFSLLRIGFSQGESLDPHLLEKLEKFSRNIIRRSEDCFICQPSFKRLIIILASTPKPQAIMVREKLEKAFAQNWPLSDGGLPDILGPFAFPEDGRTLRDFLGAAKIIIQHGQKEICEAIDL